MIKNGKGGVEKVKYMVDARLREQEWVILKKIKLQGKLSRS
jgi:hypothetical protein